MSMLGSILFLPTIGTGIRIAVGPYGSSARSPKSTLSDVLSPSKTVWEEIPGVCEERILDLVLLAVIPG